MSLIRRGVSRWLLAGAMMISAGVVSSGGAQAGVETPQASQSTSIRWTACGERLECARVRVPLDWDRPRGRTISLAVIRHLASRPDERIGSLFVNPGGPGQSGVALVKGSGSDLDAWGDGRFDVVSWDPRGTNDSTPVRCFRSTRAIAAFFKGITIPTTKRESVVYSRKVATEIADRCGRASGWLLPHVTTADTARDLDHLRGLVGDPKLTYVGFSYGTFLGQTYANMFPDRVRAMMLDGIVNPVQYSRSAEARIANGVSASDGVFDQFLRLCRRAGPAQCALAGGERTPAQRIRALFRRVHREPVPAPGLKPRGALSDGDLLLSQFEPMRTPATWPQDAANLRDALRGDASALEASARALLTPEGWAGVATSTAIQCADAPARKRLQDWPEVIAPFTRVSRMQGPVNGWWLWAPCAAWPVKGQDAYRGPWNASTATPILVIGTRYDPNTPYASAVRAQQLAGNAVLLTHDGYGHVSYQDPSACVERARVAHLVDQVTPAPGTVCEADQRPFE